MNITFSKFMANLRLGFSVLVEVIKYLAISLFLIGLVIWFLISAYNALFNSNYQYFCGTLESTPTIEVYGRLAYRRAYFDLIEYPEYSFTGPEDLVASEAGDVVRVRIIVTNNNFPEPGLIDANQAWVVDNCESDP